MKYQVKRKLGYVLTITMLIAMIYPGEMGTAAVAKDGFYVEDGTLVQYVGRENAVVIPKDVEEIGESAFLNTTIISVEIPDSVTAIGDNAFSGCEDLKEVIVPASVEKVGENVFYGCISLDRVVWESDAGIPSGAFRDCIGLTELELSKQLPSIAEEAFKGCEALTSFAVPAATKEIAEDAFDGCINMEAIDVEDGNTYYSSYEGILYCTNGVTLYRCPEGARSIKIYEGTKMVAPNAFYGCNLGKVKLPDTITTVEEGAFEGCEIQKLVVGDNVSGFGAQDTSFEIHSMEVSAKAPVVAQLVKEYGEIVATDYKEPEEGEEPSDTEQPSDTETPSDTEKPTDTETPTGTETPSDGGNAGNNENNNAGGNGATDNSGNAGNAGNAGNNGGSGNANNAGNTGNTGNAGNTNNTGNTGNSGNTGNTANKNNSSNNNNNKNNNNNSANKGNSGGLGGNRTYSNRNNGSVLNTSTGSSNNSAETSNGGVQTAGTTAVAEEQPAEQQENSIFAEQGTAYISDDSNVSGWDKIYARMLAAADGDTIFLTMNGTTIVPAKILELAHDKNLTLVLNMGNGIEWTIRGNDIIVDGLTDIDFAVTLGTSNVPQELQKDVADDSWSTQLHLAHDGIFGLTALLSVNVGAGNAGKNATLFYFDEAAGKLKYMGMNFVGDDGVVVFAFEHASDYVIVLDGIVKEGGSQSGQEAVWLNTTGTGSGEEPVPEDGVADEAVESVADNGGAATGGTESEKDDTPPTGQSLNPKYILCLGVMLMGIYMILTSKKEEKLLDI